MEKGQIIELKIDDMLDDGRAFGRYEGCAVFVNHEKAVSGRTGGSGTECRSAVPGDLVTACVTKAKKTTVEAELTEIVSASQDRIAAECPYFGVCGGCTMQELSYDAQKKLKTEQVRAKLQRLGGIEDPIVNECIGADTLKYYRNKAVFAVGPHGEVGFKKGKSHFVLDVTDCMLQSDAAMVCADALRAFLKETHAACITQMTVKTAFGTGEVMVVLEAGNSSQDRRNQRGKRGGGKAGGTKGSGSGLGIPQLERLVEMLDDAVYSLNVNEEEEDTLSERAVEGGIEWTLETVAVIENGKCRIAAGKPTITEEIITEDGRSVLFEIGPQSFFQVNPEQMAKLYDKAAEYAGIGADSAAVWEQGSDGKDAVPAALDEEEGENPAPAGSESENVILDLYCGAGTIGIWMLDRLRSYDPELFERTKVIGIESVKPAVIDANRNSVINGFINTRYICGRAEEELPGMMGLAKLYKWNEVNERVEREPEVRIAARADHADAKAAGGMQAGPDASMVESGMQNRPGSADDSESEMTGNRRENGAEIPELKTAGGPAIKSGSRAPGMMVERVNTAILDPPRAGCDEALLAAVAAAQPDRIVYVSCDPGTLARDIKYLTANGYEFIEATPVDQFPWTSHCEVTALLKRL